MPAATLKKPSARKSSPAKLVRPRRPRQQSEGWPSHQQAVSQTPAQSSSVAGSLAEAIKKLDANIRRGPALSDEELGDLIGEMLRSSPAAVSRVNAKLAADSTAAAVTSRDAGLVLVRQMQQAEGGAWTGAQLRSHFGLSAATLHRRRAEHRILYWRDAQGAFLYPKWQFNSVGALLLGVQKVLQTFRSADEWRLMRYFLAPRQQLDGQSPLALLRHGEKDRVVAHAHVHGQENTW